MPPSPNLEPETPSDAQEPLISPRLWLLLAFLPFLLVYLAGQLRPAFSDTDYPDWNFRLKASDILDPQRPQSDKGPPAQFEGDWIIEQNGASPNTELSESQVTLEVPLGYWDFATVRIEGAPQSLWWIRLTRTAPDPDDPTIVTTRIGNIASGQSVPIQPSSLPLNFRFDVPITLSFRATDPGRHADGDFALLRSIYVRFSALGLNQLPPLGNIFAVGLLPFILAVALRTAFGLSTPRAASAGLAAGLILLLFLLYRPSDAQNLWVLIAGVAAYGTARAWMGMQGAFLARSRRIAWSRPQWEQAAFILGFAFILVLGFQSRWEQFEIARRGPLDYDAQGYVEIATGSQGLYDTAHEKPPWVREPLYPWLLRLWFAIAPDSESSARLGALLLSVGMLAAVFAVGRKLFGLLPAFLAALILAAEAEWARMGVRVLRLDLLVLLTMGALATRLWLAERPWWRAGAWGAVGTGLALTRISTLSFVVPVAAWEMARRKWKPAEIVLAAAILLLFLTPHLVFNYRFQESHDPLFSSTVHSRYYLNREHLDEPGWPTAIQYDENPYQGEPVTALSYLFGYHSIGEVILRHIQGYWRIFVWGSPREHLFAGREWLMLPGLVGAVVLLLDRRRRWVLAWYALLVFPVAFIATVHHDWRLGGEAHPLVIWTWALGLQTIGLWLRDQIQSRLKKKSPAPE